MKTEQKEALNIVSEIPKDGVLLKYQKDWISDPAPVKIAEKSRRIGLTWAEAADDALTAASASGMDVFYIGYNKDMAREFIDACAFWSRFYKLAAAEVEEFIFHDDEEDRDIHAFRIDYASGHKILALSSRPSNLRGKQGIAVIDEAAFHEDLDGLMKAAMAFLMWGGKVRIISTHFGDDNPFNQIIEDVRKGRFKYSLHRTTFDGALADGLYRRICLRLKREWSPEAEGAWRQEIIGYYGEHADEELFCIPSKGSGIYFTSALVRSCMREDIPVLTWTCTPGFEQLPEEVRKSDCEDWIKADLDPLLGRLDTGLAHYFGEDFGRTIDLTVIMPLRRNKNLSLRAPFVIELRNVPFRQQEQVLFHLVDRLPDFRAGALDARGNGQYLAEVAMQRYGASRIFQVMLTAQIYQAAMPKYKVHFEDRTIEVPLSDDIIDDHRTVRLQKGVPVIPDARSADKRGKRHGDSAVAGMLAVFAVDNGTAGPIEFEAVTGQREYSSRRMDDYWE